MGTVKAAAVKEQTGIRITKIPAQPIAAETKNTAMKKAVQGTAILTRNAMKTAIVFILMN